MHTKGSEKQLLNAWRRSMRSREPTRRTDAADAPPSGAPSQKVVPLLLRALDDEDGMVRTCAADSLRLYPCDEVRHVLHARAKKERDPLARGYMLYTLGRIGTLKELAFVCSVLSKERTVEGRSFGAHGLFLGIRKAAIEMLLSNLNAQESGLRIGVCRGLADVCCGNDDPEVIDAIRSRLKVEKGISAAYMENELQDIIGYYEQSAGIKYAPRRRSSKQSKSRIRTVASKAREVMRSNRRT